MFFEVVKQIKFQSSPIPEAGCDETPAVYKHLEWLFQSSPIPEAGCDNASRRVKEIIPGFNPHPSLRLGATGH